MTENAKNPNWGGKRQGAGRKKSPIPKIVWVVKVTVEEREWLKQMLKEYREQKLEDKIYTIDDL